MLSSRNNPTREQPNDRGSVPATLKPMDRFKQELNLREDMMRALLPQSVTWEKFKATVVAAVGANPALLECDRSSLIKACIQAAELGLSLNPTLGEGDILEVYDKRLGKKAAQFRPRYMGLMKLARQSGDVLKIEAEVVREGDDIFVQKGSDPKLEHKVKFGKRGDLIGAYCVWTLRNGEKQFEVMDREQVLAIRDRSSSKTKEGKVVGPWVTDEEEMWRKTVVRRASKYMPRSCDAFVNAVTADNLAEAGADIDIIDGEVVDVTEPDPTPTEPADHGARQTEAIAKKVTQRKAADWEPQALEITVDDDGDTDYVAWCEEAVKIVQKLTPEQRTAWAETNSEALGSVEMMAPKASRGLMELLG